MGIYEVYYPDHIFDDFRYIETFFLYKLLLLFFESSLCSTFYSCIYLFINLFIYWSKICSLKEKEKSITSKTLYTIYNLVAFVGILKLPKLRCINRIRENVKRSFALWFLSLWWPFIFRIESSCFCHYISVTPVVMLPNNSLSWSWQNPCLFVHFLDDSDQQRNIEWERHWQGLSEITIVL